MVRRLGLWLGVLVATGATEGCYDAKAYPVMTTIPLSPDDHGAVHRGDLNIDGHWYAYGDAYDSPARCTGMGAHLPTQCAEFSKPEPPPATDSSTKGASVLVAHNRDFPSNGNGMCTTGSVEALLCAPGVTDCKSSGSYDYSNMWGAGIGLDFELSDTSRGPWDPESYRVIGIAFDLQILGNESANDDLPLTSLRVEFPIQFTSDVLVPRDNLAVRFDGSTVDGGQRLVQGTSEEFPGGSPLWREATAGDWNSLVRRGHNEVLFGDVLLPASTSTTTSKPPDYPLDFTSLLGVQFHAAPDKDTKKHYAFCISNLELMRE